MLKRVSLIRQKGLQVIDKMRDDLVQLPLRVALRRENALVAQSVEHHHGKVGVSGSNPLEGLKKRL